MAGAGMITPAFRSAGRLLSLVRRRSEQIRPVALRFLPSGVTPPALDRRMVAGEEHLRNRHSTHDLWARVMRMIEQTILEGVVLHRVLTSDDAGNEPRHRLEHDESGNLSAREHVIADRDLLRGGALDDALVDPLVAAGDQDEPWLCRKLLHELLIEPAAGGREHHGPAEAVAERLRRAQNRLCHQHHPWSAAERRVVDLAMPVLGEI